MLLAKEGKKRRGDDEAEGEAPPAPTPKHVRRLVEVRWRDVGRLEPILREDPVSRQSYTWRHAEVFGLDRDTIFLFLEGREDVLEEAVARVLKFARPAADPQELWRRLDAEGDDAAVSLGALAARADADAPPGPPLPEPRNEAERRLWEAESRYKALESRVTGFFWRLGMRMRRKRF